MHHVPESSRRARGVELWAALKSLGRTGLSDLIERTCAHAQTFAAGLRNAGFNVLNDVVINQVLVSFGPEEVTQEVIRCVQQGWDMLVRRHDLARQNRYADQRVFLGDERGGCPAFAGSHYSHCT